VSVVSFVRIQYSDVTAMFLPGSRKDAAASGISSPDPGAARRSSSVGRIGAGATASKRRLAAPTMPPAPPSAIGAAPSSVPSASPSAYMPSVWRAPPSPYTQEERARRSITTLYVCLVVAVLVVVPIMVVVRRRRNAAQTSNDHSSNNGGSQQRDRQEPRSGNANDAAADAAAALASALESREARRKLKEQRRAWITRLLTPVQMVRWPLPCLVRRTLVTLTWLGMCKPHPHELAPSFLVFDDCFRCSPPTTLWMCRQQHVILRSRPVRA
jgi:hypothetical protein